MIKAQHLQLRPHGPDQVQLRCDQPQQQHKNGHLHASTTTMGWNEEGTTMFLSLSPV